MRHPHIVPSVGVRIAQDRVWCMYEAGSRILDDLEEDIEANVSWPGAGEVIDLAPLRSARLQIEQMIAGERKLDGTATNCDRDMLEGEAAAVWHRAVRDSGADIMALDNPGFWCCLGLMYTWNFAAWRETGGFELKSDDHGRLIPAKSLNAYVDGSKQRECVPLRMFLRIEALGGQDYAELASAVREGTDFWASHILRVIAGEHPHIVRAMVCRQSEESTRMSTGPLREFAKQLNRTLTNVVADLLDDAAADELVGDLWHRAQGSSAPETDEPAEVLGIQRVFEPRRANAEGESLR
ncbi:MAG: hypothetical protein OXH86_14600 [Acidimicrobiaceae bacterium]|nr:hypothetical protein [Acidimicrobiaceae bacterium]MDE0318325.1 hypothetical protein [Acidimicrobiaceae bacterium]MDE0498574.1 hypothetical protein [Acidimicrobiaceae bacterium]